MATDKRELILARLATILGTIDGAPVEAVYRNRPGLPSDVRPCGLLLDGKTTTMGSFAPRRNGRGDDQPADKLMELEPGIFYALKKRKPEESEEYASEFSASSLAIMYAIETDGELVALLGTNGEIIFRGYETDMQNSMLAQGESQFHYAFRYVLSPSDLVP